MALCTQPRITQVSENRSQGLRVTWWLLWHCIVHIWGNISRVCRSATIMKKRTMRQSSWQKTLMTKQCCEFCVINILKNIQLLVYHSPSDFQTQSGSEPFSLISKEKEKDDPELSWKLNPIFWFTSVGVKTKICFAWDLRSFQITRGWNELC